MTFNGTKLYRYQLKRLGGRTVYPNRILPNPDGQALNESERRTRNTVRLHPIQGGEKVVAVGNPNLGEEEVATGALSD